MGSLCLNDFIRKGALHVDLRLGLTGSRDIVRLGVDTIVTLGDEDLVAGAGGEHINGQTILVGSLLGGVDGVDRVGVGHYDDDGVIGGLDLLGGHGVVHGGDDDGLGLVDEDNIAAGAAGVDGDALIIMVMVIVVVVGVLVVVVMVLVAGIT